MLSYLVTQPPNNSNMSKLWALRYVYFFSCLFFLLTHIYIYSPPPQTTNNAWSQWRRAQTTHLKYVFFVCLFFLLSHRHSCHHHDHGRHVRTEGKMTSSGPKQIILSFIHFMIQISNQLV